MNAIFNWLKTRSSSPCPSHRNPRSLNLERLEDRWVPATVGAYKYGMLDFDGEYVSSADMAEGGWSGYSARSFASFHSLFNSTRSWLDMNYDGLVNSTDVDLAIDHIIAKVKADFTPYMLSIFQLDQDSAQTYLNDSIIGDVSVIITGSSSTAHTSGSNWWGVAPWVDAGNDSDEIVFVFAGGSVDSFGSDRYQWLNQVARTISHEMGHAFGLDHEVSEYGSQTDALSHSIMGTTNRDWSRDFVFEDRYFLTDGGVYQNAHQHLLQDSILGRSYSTYIAVFKPGELTIAGNYANNNIQVSPYSSYYWKVVVDGQTTYVNLNSYSVHSLNPFDQAITTVKILGEDGNDYIVVDYNFTGLATVYAGKGDDIVFGGAAGDILLGEDGNDYLYGRDGNDVILGGNGDDHLSGGYGNDWLFGENGYDRVYGSYGDDYLSGGIDGVADYLNGGPGADRFAAEWGWVYLGGWWFWTNRDNPVDFNSGEGDQIV